MADGSLYLLHWEPPLIGGQRPQHYLGWTTKPVEQRVLEHLNDGPHAARIVVAAVEAGREIRLALTMPGTRDDESRLKKRKRGFAHMCPYCQGDNDDA